MPDWNNVTEWGHAQNSTLLKYENILFFKIRYTWIPHNQNHVTIRLLIPRTSSYSRISNSKYHFSVPNFSPFSRFWVPKNREVLVTNSIVLHFHRKKYMLKIKLFPLPTKIKRHNNGKKSPKNMWIEGAPIWVLSLKNGKNTSISNLLPSSLILCFSYFRGWKSATITCFQQWV